MLKIQVNGVHDVVGDDLLKYVTKKFTKLDKYIPKKARQSAHADIILKESYNKSEKNNCTCEVVMHLPKEMFAVSETTINIYAAVDIVETKLVNQLKKYKQKNSDKFEAMKLLKSFRIKR